MTQVRTLTSAGGIISLLQEPRVEIQHFALQKLNAIVDVFWAEIAEAIEQIEILSENKQFTYRQEAALVASKVYYHLGALKEAHIFALAAGDLFDVNSKTEYVETIISKCIDEYTRLSVYNDECKRPEDRETIDESLVNIVNRMFERCLATKQYRQALGIALETRRLDMLEQAITRDRDAIPEMLTYATKVCMTLVQNRRLRNQVLGILLNIYTHLENPDYVNMCQCFIFLDDADGVASALERLIREEDEKRFLMAYQLGFDLYESATQQFLQRVQSSLRAKMPGASSSQQPSAAAESATPMDVDSPPVDSASPAGTASAGSGSVSQTVTLSPPSSSASASVDDSQVRQRMERLTEVLSGDKTIEMHLQFLIRSNKTDMLILKTTKDTVRNSICHSATVMANGIMHSGTTSDQFLRENLEWLSRATNWAKFTATASLGAIHKGHEKEALHLMSTYLPKDSSTGSAYTEGGGLYALGLIYANHGGKIIDYLLKQLRDASVDAVRHGACLGLGLAAMGSARQDVYDQLLANLQQDDAVTGEAAGIAMGLVMLGTKNSAALKDMVAYAQETQHEKILRGLAVGIALTMYGCMEEADALIETLCRDKDPILRWSGMYTMAMAYCGTGNNKTLRRLLHVAVSDVNDDVRRAAVTCVGFLLFRTPEQCPSVVSLLAESYNPNVRYGAAMALGIACAGTGLKEVLSLLETMCSDSVNYVRQGALIASALVLMQHNEVTCPKVASFRQLYAKIIADKHDDMVAKFGAILAQGIIDAGGRNVTVSLQTRTGHTNMAAVVGLLVFCQFWFWYPLTHFISLAFTPTALIGLNSELKMPKIEYKSGAKPSTYAYPPPLEEKKDKAKEKVETAVLSITAKQKKKDADKKRDKKDDDTKMEVDEKKDGEEKTKVKDEKEKDEEKKEPEPLFEMLSNPARVMKPQLRVISLQEGCRYMPMKDVAIGGIVMLRNQRPEDEEQLIELVASGGPKAAAEDEEDEPAAPEPFEWNDDFLKDL